MKKESI